MKHKPLILALIPARSGSKRVKNKNIRLLGGIPLIAYTIEAAKKSKYIDRVIVSTDSKKIASVAKMYGAEVPFLRPKKISGENSTEYEYHFHALEWLKKNEKYIPDIIVNLYPTTPFRKTKTIDEAINMLIRNPRADSLRSLRKCSEHPFKMWVTKNKYIEPFVKTKNINIHTSAYHLLPSVFIQNASIYIIRTLSFYKHKSTIGLKTIGMKMDYQESIDINNETDLILAESFLSTFKGQLYESID